MTSDDKENRDRRSLVCMGTGSRRRPAYLSSWPWPVSSVLRSVVWSRLLMKVLYDMLYIVVLT